MIEWLNIQVVLNNNLIPKLLNYLITMINLKPLNDNIFIEPLSAEKVSESGIIIPDTADEKPIQGKVIAVGPGKYNEKGNRNPMNVKVGDIVLFTKYGPNEIKVAGKEYLVASESDILAIIEK